MYDPYGVKGNDVYVKNEIFENGFGIGSKLSPSAHFPLGEKKNNFSQRRRGAEGGIFSHKSTKFKKDKEFFLKK